MKMLILAVLTSCAIGPALAQDAENVKLLEQKLQKLEERVAILENYSVNARETPELKKMMYTARQRAGEHDRKLGKEELAKIEELYQKAAHLLREDASRKWLDSIVFLYPQCNRAGCAQLYRAQQESGEVKTKLLEDCIARFGDCYYFDGSQVGPLAMLQLGEYYQEAGNKHAARRIFRRLRNRYPEAVGHNGATLVSSIE